MSLPAWSDDADPPPTPPPRAAEVVTLPKRPTPPVVNRLAESARAVAGAVLPPLVSG